MDILSKAEQFITHTGRDIDQARFNYHFNNHPLDKMLAALSNYQNDNGGFYGLEVDISAPVSNPFATEIALLYCLQAAVPPDHPLLQKSVTYLEKTQTDDGDWRFSAEVYKHNLAPWFQGWEWPNLNPACTLAGLLHAYQLGSAHLHTRVYSLFQRLHQPEHVANGEFYAVRPYAYYFLADSNHPESSFYASGVLWWLIRQYSLDSLPSTGHFFEYVQNPETFTGRNMPPAILEHQLGRLKQEQTEDGGWPSPYDPSWRPHVTMQNLLVLKAFGKI